MASIHSRSHSRHGQLHAHYHRSVMSSEPAGTVLEPASPVELVRREATSSSGSGGDGGTNITVPVAVGVCVPIAIAFVLFIYLHQRHKRRLRLEDQNDPHKSLDFGMDNTNAKRKKKGGKSPEMVQTDFEKSLRRGRGLSMDMPDINNPYLLPPGMHGSRESLHSLSRTMERGLHDPYRPATTFGSPAGSAYPSSRFDDASSTRTGSTGPRFGRDGMNSNTNLVPNAQKMSNTSPISPSSQGLESIGERQSPEPIQAPAAAYAPPPKINADEVRDSYAGKDAQAIRTSNNYLAGFIHSRDPSIDRAKSASPEQKSGSRSPPQARSPAPVHNFSRKQSLPNNAVPSIMIEEEPLPRDQNHPQQMPNPQNYVHNTHSALSSPSPEDSTPFYTPIEEEYQGHDEYEDPNTNANGLGVSNIALDNKRLSIMRPLPPDDPTDTAEQRANRIRSFYKEYFRNEEPARAYQPNAGDYYEDYGQEFLADGTIYDPDSGQFIVAQAPFAEPVTRRAMTPPPRGPPRFQGRFNGHSASNPGSPTMGRSRAFSSASTSRMGPGAPRGAAKRPLPPPAPLRTLPTPHLLRDDAFLTTLSIDFAPPANFKDQAAARPQSPRGEMRPYSPQVPVASPLISSFNELSAMPSPHHLRKSGTFTALDFAPPPRLFRNDDGSSDAGSIRSGRSNHSARSAAQAHNIRAGVYRLSRIPTELVGTSREFADSLRPTWKVGS